jgi:hypothetical protein
VVSALAELADVTLVEMKAQAGYLWPSHRYRFVTNWGVSLAGGDALTGGETLSRSGINCAAQAGAEHEMVLPAASCW